MTLSPATLAELDRLYAIQNSYRPSEAIAAQLAGKTILMLVGPTCAGKNTVMEAVTKADERFKVVGTFTSRDPRPSDQNYTYYQNTDQGLQPILADIAKRRVVQYAVNRHAHLLYGSSPTDYAGEFNLADVFSSAVDQFQQLDFSHTLVISVATDPAAWLRRFNERFPAGHPQRAARRSEAIESIKWSLNQTASDHYWIVNTDNRPIIAAQAVIALAEGNGPRTQAHTLAQAMLKTVQETTV
jgi:guanylate kinase